MATNNITAIINVNLFIFNIIILIPIINSFEPEFSVYFLKGQLIYGIKTAYLNNILFYYYKIRKFKFYYVMINQWLHSIGKSPAYFDEVFIFSRI